MTGRTLSERFDRHPNEVARARRVVRAALHAWHLEAEEPTMELIVSELVSNALVHGGGITTVHMWTEADRLGLEVADEGGRSRTTPALRSGDGVGGWGLRLVEELSDDWGVHVDEQRTLVWMIRRMAARDRGAAHLPPGAGRAAHLATPGAPGAEAQPHR